MLDDMPRTARRPGPRPHGHHAPAAARVPSPTTPPSAGAHRPGSARRAAAGLLVTLVLAALALVGAPAAQAHNVLRSTDPADGTTLPFAPDRVVLTFDAAATALGTEVVVTAADGRVVSSGAPTLADATVTQPLAGELPAGAYTVLWRVTSVDGHPVEGAFGFVATAATVAGTGGAPVPTPTPTPTATAAATPAPTATAGEDAASPVPTATTGPTEDPQGSAVAGPLLVGIGGALVLAGGVAAGYLLRRRPADGTPTPTAGGADGPPDGRGPEGPTD
ncbi:copper resistance protein CopC [Cellulomonas fimi ATCC 484]|uniref:Copper resistance protein CopC n=2 Tax=Cellulomonas fimi TaxID=1708 RepID=F4H691_CELFA|nr:copper resistance protein CopC [Cellulomonas fimi ATCC 484]VEH26292.1 Copper resistance protein CopC [Cellulomonas fimi]